MLKEEEKKMRGHLLQFAELSEDMKDKYPTEEAYKKYTDLYKRESIFALKREDKVYDA
jgi:hypothetical protein